MPKSFQKRLIFTFFLIPYIGRIEFRFTMSVFETLQFERFFRFLNPNLGPLAASPLCINGLRCPPIGVIVQTQGSDQGANR